MNSLLKIIDRLFPLILKGLGSLADSLVDGAKLDKGTKCGMYAGYVIIETLGDQMAANTNNSYDNVSLTELSAFLKDTLSEAGITVPVVPDELRVLVSVKKGKDEKSKK